jgi:hypothetical protein
MPRYLVFADIINSITDITKNVRGKVPLGVTDCTLTAKNEAKLREKYRIEPNQMFRLEKIYNLEHFLVAEGKALCGKRTTRAGRVNPSAHQEAPGFVNCGNCRKKLET